ncbi:APC family permease [Fusobacterium sp.]|uniref:APC family permease n=1 Tax=Fusobacterium sp. TaxID=68766 RepID=UPI0028FFE5C3|nr:amino acid permease [Fusobacterium sp.]MDU1910956.1 amino acid permease [Fusobacterium sp.]
MEEKGLKKELGLFHAVSIVGGIMIGSGIFYVSTFVLQRSGMSPGFAILAWLIAGLMSLMAALCYAELGTSIPKSGGTYTYISEAFSPAAGFAMGLTDFFISQSGSISALAVGFATYFSTIVGLTDTQIKIMAIVMILVLSGINMLGIKEGGNVQGIFMVAKLVPIALIIVLGLVMGDVNNPMTMVPGEGKSVVTAFALSIVAALWAFDGWSSVYIVSEELKNPKKDLPKAVTIGVIGVTLIYILFNLALLKTLPAVDIAANDAPAALAATNLIGKSGGLLVAIGALLAIFGSCNGCILAYPREYYAMARDKRFFSVFAKINPKTGTPINAQIATAVVSSVLILFGTFEQLTALVAFCAWIFYTMGVSSVFVLRKKYPNLPRPYKVIGYPFLPIITIVLSLVVLIATLYEDPKNSVIGVVIPIIGVVIYYLFFKKNETGKSVFDEIDE